ncbi:Cyclase-associated protein 1 [Ananas comosus]|uniref:Cyclase-associated protein 1 n=1 Tax=Ananas comosus TaxID=4615 RepID=A0A199VY30_ANACO|nr:Cyclase-associated protein 1 [Ananas comosus]
MSVLLSSGLSWAPAGLQQLFQHLLLTLASSVLKLPGKAPAPPPPPPASLFSSETPPSQPKSGILKKVTDDMKTKNRTDRTVLSPQLKRLPRRFLSFNRVVPKTVIQAICVVYGARISLQVKGKVNNITVDKCTKTGIDVVAACEIVNCNGVEVQCQGTAPTISIDNTSGCQLYLSNDSLGASITTAKSSEINVMVPSGGPDGDWVEHALPQQYIHSYKDGQFTTSPVSHSGG